MIKVKIKNDKLASVRVNHKTEMDHFKNLLLEKKKNIEFPVKIKVTDDRHE